MGSEKPYDRRQDVGQKIFVAIVSAVLTSIFLGALGLSVRANEINNKQEVKIARFEDFMQRQDRLNDKLERIFDKLTWESYVRNDKGGRREN